MRVLGVAFGLALGLAVVVGGNLKTQVEGFADGWSGWPTSANAASHTVVAESR